MSRTEWKSLFNFTTRKHLVFLFLAVISAAASGFVIPINAYLLGKIFAAFTNFGSQESDVNEFKNELNKYVIYIVVIASAAWFFNSLSYLFWCIFGDLQAGSARERLFKALLERPTEWYDMRSDGISGLTVRILT
jgi:ATP-binding cassette subfamily B (MDR/TAP) protein 1